MYSAITARTPHGRNRRSLLEHVVSGRCRSQGRGRSSFPRACPDAVDLGIVDRFNGDPPDALRWSTGRGARHGVAALQGSTRSLR